MRPPIVPRLLLTMAAFLMATVTSACSAADDVVRVAGREAGSIVSIARTKWARHVPQGAISTTRDAVQDWASSLARVVSDVPPEERWKVIAAGCEVWSLIDLGADPSEAVDYVQGKSKTLWGYQNQVRQLAEDLRNASLPGEPEILLGRAALCAAADS